MCPLWASVLEFARVLRKPLNEVRGEVISFQQITPRSLFLRDKAARLQLIEGIAHFSVKGIELLDSTRGTFALIPQCKARLFGAHHACLAEVIEAVNHAQHLLQ